MTIDLLIGRPEQMVVMEGPDDRMFATQNWHVNQAHELMGEEHRAHQRGERPYPHPGRPELLREALLVVGNYYLPVGTVLELRPRGERNVVVQVLYVDERVVGRESDRAGRAFTHALAEELRPLERTGSPEAPNVYRIWFQTFDHDLTAVYGEVTRLPMAVDPRREGLRERPAWMRHPTTLSKTYRILSDKVARFDTEPEPAMQISIRMQPKGAEMHAIEREADRYQGPASVLWEHECSADALRSWFGGQWAKGHRRFIDE